mmetsp:Transcript_97064/g.257910  ORF Transcript_97064/g.257910 Transcript_97064/m.257910 type:complete len:219 (-) Transcript_97064:355-1011(-)
MKVFCLRSCSSRSSSLRLLVAAIISSEATPVSTEIRVQDAKAMKATKKKRMRGCAAFNGPAMSIQLSCVTTRKSVKRETQTDWNFALVASLSSTLNVSDGTLSRSPSALIKLVRKSEAAKRVRNRTRKTQMKAPHIETKAERNAVSLGNNLKMRIARKTRNSRICSMISLRHPLAGATIHRSMMPKTAKATSIMAHQRSLSMKNHTPLWPIRKASSAR